MFQVEAPEPAPGPGQVLIQMKAWSLNYRDLLVMGGKYSNRLPNPLVPLSDGVGEIADCNGDVHGLKKGQRVACLFFPDWHEGNLTGEKTKRALGANDQGVLAERVVANASAVIPVPEHLSHEEAACLPCAGLTAWNALFHSHSQVQSKTVLIMGSGGVSLFGLQFAKSAGWKVAAVSRREESLDRMKTMGLDYGVCSRKTPSWGEAIRSWSQGGVDQVLELGGGATLPQSLRAVRVGGEISLIGILGGADQEFNPLPVIMKGLALRGIFVGSKDMFQQMNTAISGQGIKPVIDRVFPFSEVKEALAFLEKGNHFGKICIAH